MSRWIVALLALLLLGGAQAAERTRGTAVTEERIALVIGNAAYRTDPLDNPVNDARLIATSLKQSGFAVALHENLDRRALIEALRDFGTRLGENTIAVLYYAGHGLQLRDRNYLIPVDAEIRSEDEIPIAGLDLGFILGRMSAARSRINIVILDACRNNPFAGKSGAKAQGLAQMDAPIGTLLAYATAPGKLAADGSGANSLYAAHLARHLLTPGLPVEHVFKRVREGVVRETREQQVPWESSSLQGEFAFVPGVAATREAAAEVDAAGELAFWNSIQASTRADEYRAYLRQYPNGRFAALAQTRLAAFTVPTPTPPPAATAQAGATRSDALPRVGDTWRYRVQDQFRIGDLFLTAKVDAVTAEGIAESWTTTSDAKLRTTLVSLEPGFHALPGWTLTPPEFSPYLLAAGGLKAGQAIPEQPRRVEQAVVPLRGRVEGEEEVVVAAGRFKAVKLVLRGRSTARGGSVSSEHVIWYSPQVKRTVKYTVATHVGNALRESTSFELVEFRLNP
ncbi:caspase family protein [Piscinibacter sp. XHJ-5]|uniref:caspase family protein n=1 Tax=Piscinibacter sp. XHJ-5 TaxID=3037797 RepID=UPI0024532545|nr:caspase family protein [Piscinibacter sp. XHJ-5]